MKRGGFTILAIILMVGIAAGSWLVERFFAQPQVTGLFVRDLTLVDREAVCRAEGVVQGAVRVEPGNVLFHNGTCPIIFRRQEEVAMAGDGPLAMERIGYRCAPDGVGPEGTTGQLVAMSGRLQGTTYIAMGGGLTEYIEAHASYLSCEEALAQ